MRFWPRLLFATVLVGLLGPALVPTARAQPRLLRWGYVVTYDQSSLASLRSAADKLDFVSPGYFTVGADGEVLGADDPAISGAARQGGAKLVPMVQNRPRYGDFTPVLAQPEIRGRAVAAIVGLVDRHGYDGIHVDFEALRPEDKPALTQFVAALAEQLRARGKLVTMAVPSRVSDAAGTWSAPYDFAELGRLCDYVVVMAYAFRTAGSATPGSISPIGQVDRAAAYTASQIPASKVLLGIGLWGYDWNVSRLGKAVTRRHGETIALGQRLGGTFGYSQAEHSAWLRYADASGSHVVWFEDRRSVEAKMAVATSHGLGGVATWRLGHEDPEVWSLFGPADPGVRDQLPLLPDYSIANGRFFTQTGGGSGRGYRVTDDGRDASGRAIRFWSEYRRLGGVDVLGYPVSRRYVGSDGFTYQAFQRGVLQWRPELGVAYLANAFEQLTAAGRDSALTEVGIPPPVVDDGSAGDWVRARAVRFGWLTESAIRSRFLANPNPSAVRTWNEGAAIQLYGLPASRPVRSGPFVVQRFQRMSLQLWVEDVPGMPPKGSVVGILGGDLLKQHGLVPTEAGQPEEPPGI